MKEIMGKIVGRVLALEFLICALSGLLTLEPLGRMVTLGEFFIILAITIATGTLVATLATLIDLASEVTQKQLALVPLPNSGCEITFSVLSGIDKGRQ